MKNLEGNVFLDAIQMLEKLQKIVDENKDDRTKEVGDRVIVWDGSYNEDKNTGKHRNGIDKLFENPGIIIETNCDFLREEPILKSKTVLDILIRFDSGEEVYTKSEFVKRIDNDNV